MRGQPGEHRRQTLERELARMEAQYELAMSAFRFEQARALRPQIDALTAERDRLSLPPTSTGPDPTRDVTPVLSRPRRRRR